MFAKGPTVLSTNTDFAISDANNKFTLQVQ